MKRAMNRKAVIGTVLVALVAAGAVGARLHTKPAPPAGPLTLSCQPGAEDVYTVAYASHGSLSDASLGLAPVQPGKPGDKPFRVDAMVDGRMHSACVASAGDEQTVALTFDEVSGSLELPSGGAGGGPAADLLKGTTLVTRDARGHTRSVRFDGQMPEGGRTLVRDFLALGQITFAAPVPGGPAPASWESHEEDTNGPYTAAYAITGATGGVTTIKKTRPRVTSALRADALRPRAEVKDGTGGTYQVDRAAGRVASVDVRSSTVLTVARREVGSTDASLALTLRESSTLAPEALAALQASLAAPGPAGTVASAASGALSAREMDARLDAQIQRKELGSDTWKTLSARLGDEEGSKTKLFLKLKALFLLEPASCAEAGRALAKVDDPNARSFSLLAGALASAGNVAAQRALMETARGAEGKVPVQRALVAAIGFEKTPSPATFDGLKQLATDTTSAESRGTARLALGSLARSADEDDPAHAGAVVASEVDSFHRARTPEEKILSLLSLGNSGAAEAMSVVREALTDQDPRVRVAAAAALRFVEASEAETVLTALVTDDASSLVRAEAIHSLSFRTMATPAMAAIARASEADADERVRMAAVQSMGGDLVGDPALVEVLERIATRDRAAGVRSAAQAVVLRYRSSRSG